MHQHTQKLNIAARIAAVVLVLVLLMAAAPTSAFAASGGSCGDGLKWSLSGGALSITGKGSMTSFSDDNMPPWYDRAGEITSVSVGEGVTSIGALAFYGCENLTHASLPTTLTSIGARSFKNCSALKYVNFPASLLTISESAFEACESLTGITLNSGLQKIGDYAFYRCSSLTSITVPSSVIDFGLVVFAYCSSLTGASLQCSLTKVPDWTFYGCTSLSSVALPATATSAGDLAFYDCENLVSVSYSGTSREELVSDLQTTGGMGSGVVVSDSGGSTAQTTVSNDELDAYKGSSTTTEVATGDSSVITVVRDTTSTYTVSGSSATFEDVWNAAADETASQPVTITNTTSTTVSATVDGSDAWAEVIDKVQDIVREQTASTTTNNNITTVNSSDSSVKVDIQLTNSTVSGSDLSALAGKDVTLNITTSDGDQWVINQSDNKKKDYSKDEYDLNYTVSEVTKTVKGIDSDTVYQVKFDDTTDFNATVGVNVQVSNAYKYASLYEKSGRSTTLLQTVVVDADGTAWFSVDHVEKNSKYYVGIDAEGVDTSDAVIPSTLASSYGSEDSTLVDADGTQYVVTGRSSSWGISGARFAIYVAIAIAAVVLIITLLMVTLNRIKKSKEKYTVRDDDDDDDLDDIDEDELRLQVMQELLEEAKRKNDK